MEYNFRDIEKKWQKHWKEGNAYKVENDSEKPKFYVLDMFPYPSGAGLHVGHPLGYIASDIYARFKRLKGFNVLHPMGFDSFGLPAEQYAIETGQHPAVTTEKNIQRYHEQLDNIGFCYDWSREVKTSDTHYYKWTQWIFLQLFDSWYNCKNQKAESISELVAMFEKEGNESHNCPGNERLIFTAKDWKNFDEKSRQDILMHYRLAYSAYGEVNWCEALGTVLANDEVVNGVSERGGHPVVKKKMRQWYLRITEYADRLLQGLEQVDFSESMKDMQRNWIGKSQGAEISFAIKDLTPNPSPKERGTKEQYVASDFPGYMTNTFEQWQSTTNFAKQNRKNNTQAEDILWQHLRNRKLKGYKFRRQHPVAGYIPDFVCIENKLIIEVDGSYHNEEEQRRFDISRSKWLEEHEYRIVRLTNEEVTKNVQRALQKIEEELSSETTSQTTAIPPSPLERGLGGEVLKVYTTRPDTIFGVDFMVIAPEHELVQKITSPAQKPEIEKYLEYVKSRSERERLAEVKQITGAFTGAYAVNPFDGREIPVWISEYVLAGYGTGAIMAVPCGDQRDYAFAKHFNIPITNIIGDAYNGEEANATKDAILQNSCFLDGMVMRDAINVVIDELEQLGIGKRKVNYKMRDAGFSRQRYWGEPFPIVYKEGIAYPLSKDELPVELPYVENYGPGPEGEGPLANIREWVNLPSSPQTSLPSLRGEGLGMRRETNTMPGYAGSSWYFLRYMDPDNDEEFVDRKAADYWGQVDLYIGGTEHAVGHLLYSRLWTKVLYDLGYIGFDEPYKKLVNQGMIQGESAFANFIGFNFGKNIQANFDENDEKNVLSLKEKYQVISNKFLSDDLVSFVRTSYNNPSNETEQKHMEIQNRIFNYFCIPIEKEILLVGLKDKVIIHFSTNYYKVHVPINYVNSKNVLDTERIKKEESRFSDAEFITLGDEFICSREVEKMSKSKLNVIIPDEVVEKYGADTFRMYEMFLGPIEQSKPWDTKGIEGVHRFLRKFWRLFVDEAKGLIVTNDVPTPAELKVLHKTIKKIEDDTERFSFNTAVSAFMVCVNELNDLKCHKKEILQPLLILLTPYAPHIAEELWHKLENEGSVLDAAFPSVEEKYLVESSKEYPITINGKVRTNINISLDAAQPEVEQIVLQNEIVQKWLDGKPPKKIIFVKGRMINVVI
jgi:leucyl-tRNA synthetase